MKSLRVISLMLCLALTAAKVCAYQDGDFQIWHTEGQEFKVTKGWKIPLEEEFRYGNDASELYYHHYDIGLAYDVNKNLNVSVHYRQIYEGEKGKFKPEYRPYIDAIPKLDIWLFKFEDRNRLEYRLFDYKDDFLEYRNRLMVKVPLKIKQFEFTPYVSDEIFSDLRNVSLTRNRLAGGITLNLTKNIKPEVYYMLQSSKKLGRWTQANILGLKLKIEF